MTSETGLTQLDHGSPAALPGGTLPAAIAPTTQPMKNGVKSDERPNRRSAALRPPVRFAVLWKAKPDPRSTIPNAARLSGMNSVEKTASKALEKPVQSTTNTKISQT